MGARDDARSHLLKAREFLAAAVMELDLERHSAAASSAVLAGINAKLVTQSGLAGFLTAMV